MAPQAGLAEVNGTRLYYEVQGSGRPLVLVHGFSLDRRMWDEQFDVPAHTYRVIRYDARGFDKSDAPSGQRYLGVDDLAALMDHLGVAGAYMVGLSMGGGISIDIAITHPERDVPRAAAALRRIIADYSAWPFVNDDTAAMPEPPPVQRLGSVHSPTLVIVGDRDTPTSLAIAGLLAESIQGARKVVLPGVGHMSNMEAPEVFNETVLNFLGSL